MFSRLRCIVITVLAVTHTVGSLQCYFSHSIAGIAQIGLDGFLDDTGDAADNLLCAKFQLKCDNNVPLVALQQVCTTQVACPVSGL